MAGRGIAGRLRSTIVDPAPGIVNNDGFSGRWTRQLSIEGGDYIARVRSDDGVRVWVDENLIIDRWQDGDTGWIEVPYSVPAGIHGFRVEYYEWFGDAFISFATWKREKREKKLQKKVHLKWEWRLQLLL